MRVARACFAHRRRADNGIPLRKQEPSHVEIVRLGELAREQDESSADIRVAVRQGGPALGLARVTGHKGAGDVNEIDESRASEQPYCCARGSGGRGAAVDADHYATRQRPEEFGNCENRYRNTQREIKRGRVPDHRRHSPATDADE